MAENPTSNLDAFRDRIDAYFGPRKEGVLKTPYFLHETEWIELRKAFVAPSETTASRPFYQLLDDYFNALVRGGRQTQIDEARLAIIREYERVSGLSAVHGTPLHKALGSPVEPEPHQKCEWGCHVHWSGWPASHHPNCTKKTPCMHLRRVAEATPESNIIREQCQDCGQQVKASGDPNA